MTHRVPRKIRLAQSGKPDSHPKAKTRRDPRQSLKKIDQALREQFDGFPIPTYIWEWDGQDFILTDFNESANLVSRSRAADFIGKTAKEVYQDRPDILEQLTQCFDDGGSFVTEMSYTIPNTTEQYYLRVFYVPLPPSRVMVLTEDNTLRVRAQEEIQQRANEFYALFENSRILASQYDLSSLLASVVDRAIALLNAHEGALFLYDPERNDLAVAVWRGPALPNNVRMNMGESVAGQVALSQTPLIVNDYRNWEHRSAQFNWLKLKAAIGTPMLFAGELVGVLVIFEREASTRQFTENDMSLLSLFASPAAAAVRNAHVEDEMRHRIAELEAVNAISKALRQAHDVGEMLKILLEETLQIIGTEAGIIWLYNSKRGQLISAVSRGWCAKIHETPIQPGEGIAGTVFLSGVPYFSTEFVADPRLREAAREQIPPGWGGACLPIRSVDGTVGILFVSLRLPRQMKSEEIELLNTLSDIAGNAIRRIQLHEDTRRHAEELALAYDSTLEGWAHALELRDKETEGHSRRVVYLTEMLARALHIPEEEIVHIRRGVLLHDIGKMGVPDQILQKAGPLTAEEQKIMQRHPAYAFEMLSSIDFLKPALAIPHYHHERWDGKGYPVGLRGGVRIFTVVDVWDALGSDRPYRKRWSEDKIKQHIRSQAGGAFDPEIVEVFLKLIDKSK